MFRCPWGTGRSIPRLESAIGASSEIRRASAPTGKSADGSRFFASEKTPRPISHNPSVWNVPVATEDLPWLFQDECTGRVAYQPDPSGDLTLASALVEVL
jgi:hypothetical protein